MYSLMSVILCIKILLLSTCTRYSVAVISMDPAGMGWSVYSLPTAVTILAS